MKLKNGIIYNSQNALLKLKNTELPIKTAYKVNKVIRVISEKIKFLEEQRNEIIQKYGREENGVFSIDKDDIQAIERFINDFNEILDIDEELDIEEFSMEDFTAVKLTSDEFDTISYLFHE